MTASTDKPRQGRRRFLKGVVAVGGTTVLVAVGRDAMTSEQAPDAAPESSSAAKPEQGYRVTSHIASYYDKARF